MIHFIETLVYNKTINDIIGILSMNRILMNRFLRLQHSLSDKLDKLPNGHLIDTSKGILTVAPMCL